MRLGLAFIAGVPAAVALAQSAPPTTGAAAPSTASPAAAKARPIPTAADFGALPFIWRPILSPDGRRYAAEGVSDGRPAIIVIDSTGKEPPLAIPAPAPQEIVWHRWAGNDRLLISISFRVDFDGQAANATRLEVLDLKTRTLKMIGIREGGVDGDDVIYTDPAGAYILLSTQRTIFDYPAVVQIDLATNNPKLVQIEREGVWNWYADNKGVVRAGAGYDSAGWWILYRSSEADKFVRVVKQKYKSDVEDIDRFFPIAGTDQGYAIVAGKSGRYGLYKYDFKSDQVGDLVYENATNDIDDFDLDDDGKLQSVSYTDDRARTEWFDPALKDLQGALDTAMPGKVNNVVSMSKDKTRIMIGSSAADDPGAFLMYADEDGRIQRLSRPYEALIGKQLSTVTPVTYTARDGLKIPAYLTMPSSTSATTGLPLVIMPHGGPFARDEWSYDAWAQFLASKGYVVLQPNFRGSTGYGKPFVEKGYGQWGRGMQDDIDDGVKWLVERGTVDAKRVCIMGASFGGYAAAWASVRNPDIYRCAISFAGVMDVASQLRYNRRSFIASRYYKDWRAKVQGDDGTTLEAVSPARRATEVRIPILIAHGDADETVPIAQSRKFVDALKAAGKPYEFYVYKGEGHGFSKAEDQIDFFRRVEAFLAKHNPS